MLVELRPQCLRHGIDFVVMTFPYEALDECRRTRLDFRAADRFQKCHDKVETSCCGKGLEQDRMRLPKTSK